MSLEKKVLNIASECEVNGAYFAYGTLFIPVDASSSEALLDFERALEDEFPFVNIYYSDVGDEVAIDFAGPKEVAVKQEEIYSPYLGAL